MTDATEFEGDDVERLEELATERWGDRWTMEIKRFTDGTQKAVAFHSCGVVDEDDEGMIFKVERIRVRDDRVLHKLVLERSDAAIETIDSATSDDGELPELDSLAKN